MVRFIIFELLRKCDYVKLIYIPIWLDLLSIRRKDTLAKIPYLHSNMVRFIMLYEVA